MLKQHCQKTETKTMPENKDCGLAEGLPSSADALRKGESSLFLGNLLASNQTAAAGHAGNTQVEPMTK